MSDYTLNPETEEQERIFRELIYSDLDEEIDLDFLDDLAILGSEEEDEGDEDGS